MSRAGRGPGPWGRGPGARGPGARGPGRDPVEQQEEQDYFPPQALATERLSFPQPPIKLNLKMNLQTNLKHESKTYKN